LELTFAPSRNSKDLKKNTADILVDDISPEMTDNNMKNVKFKTIKDGGGKLHCQYFLTFFILE
jgi:hypothetical protein